MYSGASVLGRTRLIRAFFLLFLILPCFGLASAIAAPFTGNTSAKPDPRCEAYPFAIQAELIAQASPGDTFREVPRTTGPGGFSWVSWSGTTDAPYVARALTPPGQAHTYINPENYSDTQLATGQWVYGSPGNKNAEAIRDAADNLIDQDILVPVWQDIRGQGTSLQYRLESFARLRLLDYQFSGEGWLSFEYLGEGVCGNRPPEILSEPVIEAFVGDDYRYVVEAIDPDDDPLTFSLLQAPTGMTMDSESGAILWLPDSTMLGPHPIRVQVSDGEGGTAEQVYQLWVSPPLNSPPVITSTPADTVWLGDTYAYDIQAYDPDGDRIVYTLNDAPTGTHLSLLFGTLRWTPTESDLGPHGFSIEVSDHKGASTTQSWSVEVQVDPANRPPLITSTAPTTGRENQLYSYQAQATDPDGEALTWQLESSPAGMTLSESGLISWIPQATGEYAVTVRVSDGRGGMDSQSFEIAVDQPLLPVAPVITSEPVRHKVVNENYQYQPQLGNNDPELLNAWSLTNSLPGLSLNNSNGEITGIPSLSSTRGSLQHNIACYAEPGELTGDIEPEVLWHWQGDPAYPEHVNVEHGPLVIPLADTNGDGVINANDDPAVVFVSYRRTSNRNNGILQAVSGKDGSLLWRVDNPTLRMSPIATPAAADITGDGKPEVLSTLEGGGLAMFSNQGELLWENRTNFGIYGNGPLIADINGDGSVEIVTGRHILNQNGEIVHFYSSISPHNNWRGHLPVVADITGNGIGEIIIGGHVLNYKGSRRAGFFNSAEGFSAVADITGEGKPDVVIVRQGVIRLYNNNGSLLWSRFIPGSRSWGGPPTVADMTGDGNMEIGVAGASTYVVLRSDGSVLWTAPIRDTSSSSTGSTVFDFNGDGRANIVYADQDYLRIFDGPTGEVLYQLPNLSLTIQRVSSGC